MDKNKKKAVDLTYTVEEAIETYGLGLFQLRVVGISGILQSADAMELLLLSVLGPTLRCTWNLVPSEVAFITTIVFVGYLLGAPLWGKFSDKYGRKTCLLTVLSLIAYFGLLTTLSPSFVWILILRGIVGFNIGGGSKYLPMRHRATVLLAAQLFWAIGGSLEIGLSFLILPRFGWRWLVFASSMPLALFLGLLVLLPESVRYLIAANRLEEAQKIVSKIAKMNNKIEMEGRLVASETSESSLGNFMHLFAKRYLCTSLLLPIIWFGAAFTYYGSILVSSDIFRFHSQCFGVKADPVDHHGNLTAGLTSVVDTSCCVELQTEDYTSMLVSSLGEFAILPLNILMVNFMGRRFSLACVYFLLAVFFIAINACVPSTVTIVFLFILRALSSSTLNLVYLYTTEVYPTTIRSLGLGLFTSISRLGAMSTPYVAQVLMPEVSVVAALGTYSAMSVLCAIASGCLPIETKGRAMQHSVDSEIEISDISTKK
nr:unnamed protein product [Spirometra erinaceieuropaei]